EERGNPRGEFLRIQTELAGWVPDLERRTALLRRQEALLAAHEEEWLGPLREHCARWYWEAGVAHVELKPNGLTQVSRALSGWLRAAWAHTVHFECAHLPDTDPGVSGLLGARGLKLTGLRLNFNEELACWRLSAWLDGQEAALTHLALAGVDLT